MEECQDYNGKVFPSKAAMCDHYGVKTSFFDYRRKQGMPLKQCLTPYKHEFCNIENGFEYNGIEYKSLRDCCNKLEINYHTVYNKITVKCYKPKEAIEYVLMKKKQISMA